MHKDSAMSIPVQQATGTEMQHARVFLSTHLFGSPPYPKKRFDDQTIIVTGSNTGLGLEAARHFVRLGAAKVILAVRSVEKGEEAATSIAETEKREGVVEVWELDLGSYASVKEFAARAATLERLDIVVSNAGVYLYDFSRAEDNETTTTVNVVSTFLLGILLLPKLRESSKKLGKPAVLTFVGSFVHYMTTFPEGDAENILQGLAKEEGARMTDRYVLQPQPDGSRN
jgi:NAD(P)-dependent dehydrogenase (short-subunit alcohol dehydrogenase family)